MDNNNEFEKKLKSLMLFKAILESFESLSKPTFKKASISECGRSRYSYTPAIEKIELANNVLKLVKKKPEMVFLNLTIGINKNILGEM